MDRRVFSGNGCAPIIFSNRFRFCYIINMPQNQLIRFTLNISADQFLNVYRGSVRKISVLAEDGRRIEFPASNIHTYLSRDGIQGHFEMELTAANKFIAIRKMPA